MALVAGEEWRTKILRDTLEDNGVFGSVFCWPATPRNKSLVRFSVHADLSREELDRVLAVCAKLRGAVGLAEWPSTKRKAKPGGRRHRAA